MLDAAVICRPDCRQVCTSTLPRRSPSAWQASLTPASGIACAPPATTTKSPARSRAGSHIGDRLFLAAPFLADLVDEEVDGVHGLPQAARHCRTGRILSADDDGRYAVDPAIGRAAC